METIKTSVFRNDWGWMCATVRGETLCELTFGHRSPRTAFQALRHEHATPSDPDGFLQGLIMRLQALAGDPGDDFLDLRLDVDGHTAFQLAVIQCCREIRVGETATYADLARQSGRPRAARAVGQVMANNRFPLIVPCHRVVGSSGSLGGYSARDGLDMKRRLLALEAAWKNSNHPTTPISAEWNSAEWNSAEGLPASPARVSSGRVAARR